MAKLLSRGYDLNVYIVDGVLRLSAYEWHYDDSENPEPSSANTEKFITLPIPLESAYDKELSYLLGSDWNKYELESWQDYDSWEDLDRLKVAETPLMLFDWAKGLPEYEPVLEHEWEGFNFNIEHGTSLTVHCLNCDETYEHRRLSFDEMKALGI